MNPEYQYTRPSKFTAAARTILRFAPAIYLFSIFLYAEWRYPQLREHFTWPAVRHGLWLAALIASAAILLLCALTVIVFAFNADWHTGDGFTALLFWLLAEVLIICLLTGLCLLVAAVLRLVS